MRLQSLIHLLQAAAGMTQHREILVLGSASLLASFPDLGEKGQPLETTLDADFLIPDDEVQDDQILDEALGEGSLFSARVGYYVHVLRPSITETLPKDWETRLVALPQVPGAKCLHPLDLALVKLSIGREKDLALLRALLDRKLLDLDALRVHFHATPLGEKEAGRISRSLHALAQQG